MSHLCLLFSWRAGLPSWSLLSSVPELHGIFAAYSVLPSTSSQTTATHSSSAASHTTNATAGNSSAPTDPTAIWYYSDRHHVTHGPVPPKEIIRLYSQLQLSDVSMVFDSSKPGAAWTRLSEVESFAGLLGQQVLDKSADEPDKKRRLEDKEKPDRNVKAKKNHQAVNSSIYITGLPDDVTQDEVFEYVKMAGIVAADESTGSKRIKLYLDSATGKPKGDAVVKYAMPDSVKLAVQLLDQGVFRYAKSNKEKDVIVSVQPAEFENKSAGDKSSNQKNHSAAPSSSSAASSSSSAASLPPLPPTAPLSRSLLHHKLSWSESDDLATQTSSYDVPKGWNAKIIVVYPLFNFEEVNGMVDEEKKEEYVNNLKNEIGEEVEKNIVREDNCLEKITVFTTNPHGIVAIKLRNNQQARLCISNLNNRLFNGKKLSAFYWNNKDNYNIGGENEKTHEQIEAEEEKRLEQFGAALEK